MATATTIVGYALGGFFGLSPFWLLGWLGFEAWTDFGTRSISGHLK